MLDKNRNLYIATINKYILQYFVNETAGFKQIKIQLNVFSFQ